MEKAACDISIQKNTIERTNGTLLLLVGNQIATTTLENCSAGSTSNWTFKFTPNAQQKCTFVRRDVQTHAWAKMLCCLCKWILPLRSGLSHLYCLGLLDARCLKKRLYLRSMSRGSEGSKRTFSFLCFFKIMENLLQKHQFHPSPLLLQANLTLYLADPNCFVFSCLSEPREEGRLQELGILLAFPERKSVDPRQMRVLYRRKEEPWLSQSTWSTALWYVSVIEHISVLLWHSYPPQPVTILSSEGPATSPAHH